MADEPLESLDLVGFIPEADLLEQQTPLGPQQLTDAETVPPAAVTLGEANEANEADRVEQHAAVHSDGEDDYAHDTDGTGRS